MLRYIAKRVLMLIPVLIGITLFIYLVLHLAPGDPAISILGQQATAEQVAAKRIELGLDKPFIVQYGTYMLNVLKGDFGTSWFQGFSVMNEFTNRLPYTLQLASIAIMLSALLGIPLGALTAVRHNKPSDLVITFLSLLLASAPGFWLGMMGQTLFSLKLGILPASGVGNFSHLILPATTLSASMVAGNCRLTRSWLLDVIRSDYVRTARAKGAGEVRVIMKHALRNALIPVVTGLGIAFSAIMGGSVVTETVFSFPGIGSYLINAVKTTDIPIVMGCIIILAVFVGIINLVVDLTYAFIDPRVKVGGA